MTQGERIKNARISRNLSQDQLAKIIGTTKQTIFKYENDIITNIPRDKIIGLSNALNISISYLIMGVDAEKASSDTFAGLNERIKIFNSLSPEDQAQAMDYMRFLSEKEGKR